MTGQDAPPFVPGLTLSKRFYFDVVRPLLAQRFPGLAYSAALLGAGSEVFGYDTPMSTDHDWGPRVLLFLPEDDAPLEEAVGVFLRGAVPDTYAGFAVPPPGLPDSDRDVPVRAYLGPLRRYVRQALGHDSDDPLDAADWLTIPSQSLREITAGEVFHDGLGTLEPLRRRLAYYPHDVWLYLLASGWQRLGQDEHLMPRAGLLGDELGSSLIGARLVQGMMHLCFLMERRYAPYSKWLGTAFGELACAGALRPLLWRACTIGSASRRPSPSAPRPFSAAPFASSGGALCPRPLHRDPRSGRTRHRSAGAHRRDRSVD